jgi:hypothetical protein
MPAPDAGGSEPAMKPFWFLLWGLVIGQLLLWTFAPTAAPPQPPQRDPAVAFGSNEDIHVQSRIGMRSEAFKALDLPWGNRCSGDGRKRFVGGLSAYYYQRQNQTERYPENFGNAGADYIAKQWSTTDDQRIDRLTQDAYAKGYLNPADLEGLARKAVENVVKGERVTGKGCAT